MTYLDIDDALDKTAFLGLEEIFNEIRIVFVMFFKVRPNFLPSLCSEMANCCFGACPSDEAIEDPDRRVVVLRVVLVAILNESCADARTWPRGATPRSRSRLVRGSGARL